MSNRLELEVVLRSIESAFKPLRCVAEDFDYGDKVRFRVFSQSDEPLLRVEESLVRRITEPDGLAFIVGEARRNLEGRGFTLVPWQPPSPSEAT